MNVQKGVVTKRSPFHFFLFGSAVLIALLPRVSPAQTPPPTDDEIRAILRTRIDTEKRGVGLAVGWVDAQGHRVVSYGQTALSGGHEVNGQTIFEIGSITKVFTAALLAQAVERGDMALADPVAKYLPAGVKVPARGDRQITLLDLATHRSGLPSMPPLPAGKKPGNPGDPYADYTAGDLDAFLAGYTLTRDIGSQFEYSNLGMSLLGRALASQAKMDYEPLVVGHVCEPLRMLDTRITLPKALAARLAAPYDEQLAPAANWNLGTFAPAGGLRSDVDDLLKFLAANLGGRSPLAAALKMTHEMRNNAGTPTMDIGLAWHINKRYSPPITWHNGGTGGYRSFIGFDDARRRGVVVLSNTANSVDDIGRHLLDPRFPLNPPPKVHTAIRIDPAIGDLYAGRYQIVPEFVLTFSREGEHYYLQATDQPKGEVFPESATDFFSKEIDGQVTFVKDADGKYSSLILHQRGIPDQTARRLP